ncbi:MAG: hypothetical protein ACFFBD_19565 [Candidatus Hodarchaeota archaeon]
MPLFKHIKIHRTASSYALNQFNLSVGKTIPEILQTQLSSLNHNPSQNRNSFYSLLPTLSLLTNAPIIILAGQTIHFVSLAIVMIVLMMGGALSAALILLSVRFLPYNLLVEEFEAIHKLAIIGNRFKKWRDRTRSKIENRVLKA